MKSQKGWAYAIFLIVILSLVVLSCEAAASMPNPFATETPTPTATFTPSPTPTATVTPTPLPSGVKTEARSDGTTLFLDYDNQYQVILPKGWIVIPLSGEDFIKILSDLSKKNPDFGDMAKTFRQLDPKELRAAAINSDRKYIVGGYGAILTVVAFDEGLTASLPLAVISAGIEETIKQNKGKILSSDENAKTNANEVEIWIVDSLTSVPTATGNKVEVRAMTILFKSHNKLIVINLATPKQFGEEFLPAVDEIVESIKFLQP